MLQPKKLKYRKYQRGRMKGKAQRGNRISFGTYGLKALEAGWLKGNQIEAARVAITRELQKNGKLWIRVYPDKPVTSTPAETRMGKGKGEPEYYVAVIKPGRILFEIEIETDNPKKMFKQAQAKLPMKTKIVKRK
jgi:large subunit ribosomal protein L16